MIIPVLQRFRLSPVLGYLLCGIVVGPFGLGAFIEHFPYLRFIAIQDRTTAGILGELGIMTLMFMIGLELSFARLRQLKRLIFGLGTSQIILTAIPVWLIARAFGNTNQAAIIIGLAFSLSSTAIVMKLLEENKMSNRPVGTLAFSVLLMQDLAVVPILVLLASFAGNTGDENIFAALGLSMLIGAVTITAIIFLGKLGMRPLLRMLSGSSSPEWLAAFVVFFVLACAAITDATGLSLALGAFLAGLLIAETEFRHEVESIIDPLKGLLMGIFFLSVGMMTNLADVLNFPFRIIIAIAGIFILKFAITFISSLIFQVQSRISAEIAVYLAQPGEFALMIFGIALTTQLLPPEDAQFFTLVTVIAMLLTPLIFKLAPAISALANKHITTSGKNTPVDAMIHETRVIIAGFGRMGELLADALEESNIAYMAFDKDGQRVQAAKARGYRIIYGDAQKKSLWRHLVHENVEAIVVATDAHKATEYILTSIRKDYPLLPVIVRGESRADIDALYKMGATHAVAETLESSLRIAEILMLQLNHNDQDVHAVIDKLRKFEKTGKKAFYE